MSQLKDLSLSKWFSKRPTPLKSLTLLLLLFTILCAKHIHTLTHENFQDMKSTPLNTKYSTIKGVKGLFHIKSNTIYYLPPTYTHHFDYCGKMLQYAYKLTVFNRYNYSPSKNRSYICFNLNSIEDTTLFIEFSVGDKITAQNLLTLYKAIDSSLQWNSKVKVLCNTESITDSTDLLAPNVLLAPNELFSSQPYQIVQEGTTKGRLKLDSEKVTPNDIVLIKSNFISPPVAKGYITTEMITPLSHIAMLARTQNAPLVYLRDYTKITILLDSFILLSAKNNLLHITKDTTSSTKLNNKRNKLIKLKINTTPSTITPIINHSYDSRYSIGNKAANFAELTSQASDSTFLVPEHSFAISFSAYENHIKACQINEKISALNQDTTNLKVKLKIIKERIKREPLQKDFIHEVHTTLIKQKEFTRFRFRSSSNVEDINGFSGAGLYSSKSANIAESDSIEKAIKCVWASLWNERAVKERHRFGIDQRTARMGILIHRAFPNETVNGVAVTENLYRNDFPYGYVFNIQKGDFPVVTNNPTHRSELLVSYFDSHSDFYNRINSVDYINYSSFTNAPLLEKEEIKKLTLVLKRLEQHFYKTWNIKQKFKSFSIDVEFKLDTTTHNTDKIYIKQVRPF